MNYLDLVIDTSVLIDLNKAGLINPTVKCARKIILPDIVWREEAGPYLDTAACEALQKLDAKVIARAQNINQSTAFLSLCARIYMATVAMLLTGDK